MYKRMLRRSSATETLISRNTCQVCLPRKKWSLDWCRVDAPETNEHPIVQENQGTSSSSSRKRKREQDENNTEESHHQLVRSIQRTSSREMMPPPPIQAKQRREKPTHALQIPESRTMQRLDTSGSVSHMTTVRYPTIQTQDTSPPVDIQVQEASRSHIGPRAVAPERPYPEYGYQTNGSIPHEPYEHYHTEDRGLASSFNRRQGSIMNPPTHLTQLTRSPAFPQNDHSAYAKNRGRQQDQLWDKRQPLRPIHVNAFNERTSAPSYYHHMDLEPALTPRKAREPNAGSVSSPFFQRNLGSVRGLPIHPPPPRGGDVYEVPTRQEPQPTATLKPQWSYDDSGTSKIQDQFRSSRQVQPSSHGDYSEPAPFTATLPYRNFTENIQASDELRPRHDSRAYLSSSQRSGAERQHFPASRGRITLPPSQSSTRDYELSTIRGLRGGYPQQAEGFSVHRDSGYPGSRPLFSASSRRSVRR